MNLISLDI